MVQNTWLNMRNLLLTLITFLFSGMVAAAPGSTTTVLAVNMTKTTGGNITTAGIAGWNLWSNGNVSTNISALATTVHTIKVRANGSIAGGVLPAMDVLVDGVSVKKFNVTAGSWNDYSFTVTLSQGSRRISLAFTNDAIVAGADRNLYIYNLIVTEDGAATTSTPSNTVLAVNMTKSAGGAITTGGLAAWNLWSNGSVATNFSVATTATHTITVRANGSAAGGIAPAMDIQVDGVTISKFSVTAGSWINYSIATNLIQGSRRISVAFTNDAVVGTEDRNLYVYSISLAQGGTATAPAPTPPMSSYYPLAYDKFFINPWTGANFNRNYCPAMSKIANNSSAIWLAGGSNELVAKDLGFLLGEARNQGATPTVVVYNVPYRDCGLYSAGGTSAAAYPGYIENIARTIGNQKTILVLEPDALAQATDTSCLNQAARDERINLIKNSVATFRRLAPNSLIYIDGGNPGWLQPSVMADMLNRAGISQANGFALNVSNFAFTSANVTYGTEISKLTGGKHFVVDTSRNGNGPGDRWCNPEGRALGTPSRGYSTGLMDAVLWIKPPGDSDGACYGYSTGFLPGYACGLAERAPF